MGAAGKGGNGAESVQENQKLGKAGTESGGREGKMWKSGNQERKMEERREMRMETKRPGRGTRAGVAIGDV
jgi:hypothetical protein